MALSNRKLTAKDMERAGGAPHQQLVTDGDGVAQWEDKPFGVTGKETNYVLESIDVTMSHDYEGIAGFLGVNKAGVYGSISNIFQITSLTNVYVRYDDEEYFFEGEPTCLVNQGSGSRYAVQNDKFMIVICPTSSTWLVSFDGNIGDVHNVSIYGYGDEIVKTIDPKYLPDIIIPSSTEGSTKRFMLTVDDSGTITATEVT